VARAEDGGFLLSQDTYFVGTINGVGRICMQSVLDTHCSLAFAKLYLSKLPMTAVDVLNDRVLPFYEEQGVDVEHLLTACYQVVVKICGSEASDAVGSPIEWKIRASA
jgi:hypothetical protein